MKKRLSILATVFLLVCSMGLLSAIPAYAGGGINWKVTVKNPTTFLECHVDVFILTLDVSNTERTIQPGGETTWSTGAYCPAHVLGRCWIVGHPNKTFRLQATDMHGTPVLGIGTAACWNSTMKICKKRGDDANPQDGDYSFCRD